MAIIIEHALGPQQLNTVYRPYFRQQLQIILDSPIPNQLRWFLIIRSGRESTGTDITDDITTD
eukprot:scaffold2500_cov172-Chaetoceros_neogracile.AAC.3